jgi:hypothetical protein
MQFGPEEKKNKLKAWCFFLDNYPDPVIRQIELQSNISLQNLNKQTFETIKKIQNNQKSQIIALFFKFHPNKILQDGAHNFVNICFKQMILFLISHVTARLKLLDPFESI